MGTLARYGLITRKNVKIPAFPKLLSEVNQHLSVRGSNPISDKTLRRQLEQWRLSRKQQIPITPDLVNRVRFYFYSYGFNNQSIL